MARPSDYTEETAAAICDQLADGKSLRSICKADEMPDARTVFRWLEANETFRQQYARARERQADALAEEILDIADEDPAVAIEAARGDDEDAVVRVDGAAIQHQRLRVDVRKWYASKVAPKKYGELVRQELSGADGGPIQHAMVEGAEALRKSIRG